MTAFARRAWQPPTPDGPFGYLFHGTACQCEDCTQGEDEGEGAP